MKHEELITRPKNTVKMIYVVIFRPDEKFYREIVAC